MEEILSARKITKRFPQVVANNEISFNLRKREIHFLVGENGAGKTTLVNCFYGSHKPDSGRIFFKGKEVHLDSPSDALKLGIGLIHQHFVLIPRLSVVENIIVGTGSPGPLLDLQRSEEKIKSLCSELEIDLDITARVQDLSVGEKQWVEILKAIYLGTDVLMLDEPTAVQTPQETRKLFDMLRHLRESGMSFIVVTHKLHEAMELADRITVLRGGQRIATVKGDEVTERDLARMMVGRDVLFRIDKKRIPPGETVLSVGDLSSLNDRGQEVLKSISFKVRKHEILGIAGVAGNGQKELFEVLMGVRRPESGNIFLNGLDISGFSPKRIISKGLSSIPEDRIGEGLVMDFSVEENLLLGSQRESQFKKLLLLDGTKVRKFARRIIQAFGIACSSPRQVVKTLSGGNLQKVILGRELSRQPRCLIANQPTRGLDVGSTEFVRKRLIEQAKEGVAVLLISEDLQEILDLSDRIAVMFEGRIMEILKAEKANREKVGLLMAGILEENC